MKESIKKRIEAIKESEGPEDLKKCLCPFFEKGGYPDCLSCRKTEADLDDCRDYYLERIPIIPLDIWTEEFDKFIAKERDTISLEEVSGIGVTCNNCYMYDKCPLYKKDYVCGIKWGDSKPTSPADFMDFLINVQYERVRRSSIFEKVDGGVPDAGLSGEMDRLQRFVLSKIDMGRERLSISVEASGSATKTTEGGGGILAKLFGGGSTALPDKTPIEIPDKPESRKGIIDVTDVEEVKEAEKVPRKRKRE